jgi:predicted cupin superfamily sugar epimerase
MLQLRPDGTGEVIIIGNDLSIGMRPQVIVPAGVWQGSRLAPGGRFALMGTTMSIGFEFEDYTSGIREELSSKYPTYREFIQNLTAG